MVRRPDEPVHRDSHDVPANAASYSGLQTVRALRLAEAGCRPLRERVIEETPVALLYNGVPFAVMMATPRDLDDFALGFALTEGIVVDPGEFELVDTLRTAQGISLQAMIPSERFEALEARKRNLTGRSGCGLCGTESLDEALRPPPRVTSCYAIGCSDIIDALARLASNQPLNASSGGVHAAGFARTGDAPIVVREDVGRHNALDKLAGALARDAPDAEAMRTYCGADLLVITSRASWEIVHKAAHIGIAVIAAISAPTSLAIRAAEEAGITLIAFARDEAMNVYTHPRRVT